MGQGTDLELVGAEEVGVVGGGEVGGQFVEFGVDGLADLPGESLDVGPLLGWQGLRGHDGLRSSGSIRTESAQYRLCVQRFHQLSRRIPEAYPTGRFRVQ